MRARHRSKRGEVPRVSGAFHGNGDQSRAEDRLRSRRGDCKRERENRAYRSRNCQGEKSFAGERTRARTGPDQNDRARGERIAEPLSLGAKTMVAKLEGPQFSGGANIAIKCPSHTYEQTVAASLPSAYPGAPAIKPQRLQRACGDQRVHVRAARCALWV